MAGTGLGGAVTGDPINTAIFTPLILPGLFTSTVGQSAVPVDRVFFDYGYFSGFQVRGVGSSLPKLNRTTVTTITPPTDSESPPIVTTTVHNSISQSGNPVTGFNLNTFNLGIEKTFLDGLASFYVSVPFLYATQNISGQDITGLSDINVGFKVILYQDRPSGNTFTGGLTVSFPSAHASVSTSFVQSENGNGNQLLPSTSVRVNPTYFQPWVAGLVIFDRFWVHDYFGVVVPTDSVSPRSSTTT